jgi:8-amino-7-oxononanoate synthase
MRDDTGRELVSFASNDYLGLTRHPHVIAAAHEALDRFGAGSGSARLITGSRTVHADLEETLAAWKGEPAAVLFPTGFATNLGVLSAFGGADVTVVSDELNHASIIDGCRLSRSEVAVYHHADPNHAATMVTEARRLGRRVVVVTDTVFSMDGDTAPIDDLAELCRAQGALLVIDEAHAVLGPEPDLDGIDHIRVGTLSKTLGSLGGFAATSTAFARLLVNRSRPFIFTTGSAPADAAAALAAVAILRSAEGAALVARLRANVNALAPGHPSPIIPIVLGAEDAALAASAALLERGLLVPAIRPPTVPPGTCRLRVAVSAAHTASQIDLMRAALAELADVAAPVA